MNECKVTEIQRLLKSEIVEVVGCTEPAAIAYAFSSIMKYYDKEISPDKVKAKLYLSKEVYRNAKSVNIPHLKRKGIYPAVALGIFSDVPNLNVFSSVTEKQLLNSIKLLRMKKWLKIIRLKRKGVFIYAELYVEQGVYKSIIRNRHNKLDGIVFNKRLLFEGNNKTHYKIRSMKEIWDIVTNRNIELGKLAKSFLIFNGKEFSKLKSTKISDQVYELIRKRMTGEYVKILTIVGSGNHGIFLSGPFYEMYKKSADKILPAVLFSILTAIYLTQQKGRLARYCGLSYKAGPALIAGLLYDQNKNLDEILFAMKQAEKSTKGLLCDGAEETCGNKGYLCLSNVLNILENSYKNKV